MLHARNRLFIGQSHCHPYKRDKIPKKQPGCTRSRVASARPHASSRTTARLRRQLKGFVFDERQTDHDISHKTPRHKYKAHNASRKAVDRLLIISADSKVSSFI
ncbi:hypothetical protein X777_00484 [Ooceraea biroi]|uniref:Uncharacterized protein n=1 Tax=Ooceraea biroi TaxID=2015173 RepID=A0A026WTR3_OOCBI|nr:hypothetical protein X777_00484 [Ooceraea biroi]